MSNFAERLVARSAGTPPGPGISVLAARPVSRFETVGGIEVETTVAPDLAPPRGDRPFAAHETGRTSAKMVAAQSRPGGAVARPHVLTATLTPLSDANETPPDHTIQDAASPDSDIPAVKENVPQQLTQSTRRNEDGPALRNVPADDMIPHLADETEEIEAAPPRVIGRYFEVESAQAGRPVRGAGHASAGGAEQAGQSPAPAISIGKIEVQFLPQEPRIPAARPQPQRTRGFDAYARARRGEPR